jgi:hypothetical protein
MIDNETIAYDRFKSYSRSHYFDRIEWEDIAHEMFILAFEAEKRGKLSVVKQRYSWLYLRAVRKVTRTKSKVTIKLDHVANEHFESSTYERLYDFLELNCPDVFGTTSRSMERLSFKVNGNICVDFSLSDLRELLAVSKESKDKDLMKRMKKFGFTLYCHDGRFHKNINPIAEKLGISKPTVWARKLVTKYTFCYQKNGAT